MTTNEEIVTRATARHAEFDDKSSKAQVYVGDIARALPLIVEDVPELLRIIAEQGARVAELTEYLKRIQKAVEVDLPKEDIHLGTLHMIAVELPSEFRSFCQTCNGHGEVGGLTMYGYDSVQCPVCQGSGIVGTGSTATNE